MLLRAGATRTAAATLLAALLIATTAPAVTAQEGGSGAAADDPPHQLVFPVGGDNSFNDTYGDSRSDDRTHQGTDIFAVKLTPVVAAADGVVVTMRTDGPRAGVYVKLLHHDGWSSLYIHLNNDTLGTDDGLGTGFVEGLAVGQAVTAGEVIGYVGDSGNAEDVSPHLHFELHNAAGDAVNPYPYLAVATRGAVLPPAERAVATSLGPSAHTDNTTVVGHFDPGGGFTSDLWVADDVAYLASWGRPGACPASGVRMVDVADPTQPSLLGVFADAADFPSASAEDVWAGEVETEAFTGVLAVVAIRLCDTSERSRWQGPFRGLALYDVTDPTAPELIGTVDSGEHTQGVHEVQVTRLEDGRLLAVASVPQSFLHHPDGEGDIRILDITDPHHPRQLADWDIRRDGPAAMAESLLAARGDEELRGHGVGFGGGDTELAVWHWDAGMVRLDITDPNHPVFVDATGYVTGAEGNAHSGWYDPEGRYLITNDEDLHPVADDRGHVAGWGSLRIFDLSGAVPQQVGSFATANALPGPDGEVALDGFYTAHDVAVAGDLAVVSWYSDGVRLLDLTDLAHPVEVGSFVPPPAVDPYGYWDAPDGTRAIPVVWGVQLVGDLVYASDINSGLWIVRIGLPSAVETDLPPPELYEIQSPQPAVVAADVPSDDPASPPADASTMMALGDDAIGGASW